MLKAEEKKQTKKIYLHPYSRERRATFFDENADMSQKQIQFEDLAKKKKKN